MPAKNRNVSGQSWGITYADVAAQQDAVESHHNCTVEFGIVRYLPYKAAGGRVWGVSCTAVLRRGKPDQVVGVGQCQVGGNRGAASMAGAMLRALIDAGDNLEERTSTPARRVVTAKLPGFE